MPQNINTFTARSTNLVPADCQPTAHVPAAATQATISKAAAGAGIRHCARRAIATVAAAAAAVTPVGIALRDGATGAGTILIAWTATAIVNAVVVIDADMLEMLGTANTAMTLEFAAASAAGSLQTVTLWSYTIA